MLFLRSFLRGLLFGGLPGLRLTLLFCFDYAETVGLDALVNQPTAGSQGAIEMMVGINAEGKVTGVSIVKHSETPNIGTKVVGDQAVLDRFTGMSLEAGEITVNGGANRFDG